MDWETPGLEGGMAGFGESMQYFFVHGFCMESLVLIPLDTFVNFHLREDDLRLMLVWKWGLRESIGKW